MGAKLPLSPSAIVAGCMPTLMNAVMCPSKLDWQPGEFFDDSRLYLICSVHGALYAPESGRCLSGRCQGKGLKALAVEERDGTVYLCQKN